MMTKAINITVPIQKILFNVKEMIISTTNVEQVA
jgi:hypothetical protein